MSLVLRNVLFSVIVPGSSAFFVPAVLLAVNDAFTPKFWPAVVIMAGGVALYLACVQLFAVIGRGTPGPWDAPRHLVVVGPYRWVRNPIYIAVLLVLLGETWLFQWPWLLVYAAASVIITHLMVIGHEEPALRRTFGEAYVEYCRTVSRWIPRLPRRQ